ncbi:hypothetical protein [Blastococcus sp. SYSU DS0617]
MPDEWLLRQWLVGLVALLLSGFGPGDAPQPIPVGLPDVFADRPVLPDCGRVDQYIGQDEPQGAAVDCFEAALAAGGTAELVVVGYGADAGPVFLYHRALPGGGMETFLDHRRDNYRSADWQQFVCPEARSLRDLGECTDRELEP